MLRKLLTLSAFAMLAVCMTGCDSSEPADDAPKGGERRPVTEGKRQAPGPGAEGLGTGGTETDPGGTGGGG
jgi:hypothetical protein